tara:strand:+ start:1058 stop:1789 length:732 start_codon:yes stop_codon:yes gene_type:complete
MKISEIPSDTFAAKLSNDELEELENALSDSKKIAMLRVTCQLEQIRRGGRKSKPKPPPSDDPEEGLRTSLQRIARQQFMGELSVLIDLPYERKVIEHEDPIFMASLYAAEGLNETFGNDLIAAMKRMDIDFLDKAQESIKAVKIHTSKKKLRSTPMSKEASKHSFGLHAFWIVRIWDEIERSGKTLPTKNKLRKLVTKEIEDSKSFVYRDESDWGDLWALVKRRCGIKPHEARVGRSANYWGE